MSHTAENIEAMTVACGDIAGEYTSLRDSVMNFKFSKSESNEHALHGLMRRLKTVQRCVERIYQICPADRTSKLSYEESTDLQIHLQAYIFNVYGCLDNIAWILTYEKDIRCVKGKPLPNNQVSLLNDNVQRHLSAAFRSYISEIAGKDKWLGYLQDYRHALAHRIPIYVPPSVLTSSAQPQYDEIEALKNAALEERNYDKYFELDEQQDALGKFWPVMIHSYSEGSRPVMFHPQIIADWRTVTQLIHRTLEELAPPQ